MTEQEARLAIIKWAEAYFAPELEDSTPDVTVVSIAYEEEEDVWVAELEVSASADNPTVTFWVDDHHQLAENRIHVQDIEY